MSSPLVQSVDINVPDDYQSLFSLLIVCAMLILATTTFMDVGYIRHRWRRVHAASRVVGFQAATLAFVWMSEIPLMVVLFGLVNGFVDPRLHLASFQRNPKPLWRKAFFSIGTCLHHAGAALMVRETVQPLVDNHQSIATLPLPILIVVACEMVGWLVELQVLYRQAPKWFLELEAAEIAVQIICLGVILLFVETTITTPTLVATTFGNATLFISLFTKGDGASTHEYPSSEAGESGCIKDKSDIEHGTAGTGSESLTEDESTGAIAQPRSSVARLIHGMNPIVEDCSTSCVGTGMTQEPKTRIETTDYPNNESPSQPKLQLYVSLL